jgi:hypothetical protein
MMASTCGQGTTVTDTPVAGIPGYESSTGPSGTHSRVKCYGAAPGVMTGGQMVDTPMSEHEYQQKLIREAIEAKAQERVDAHNYLNREYAKHGLDEGDRDEILAALGITESELGNSHDLSVARVLSRAGLTYRPGKSVVPRTAPARGV